MFLSLIDRDLSIENEAWFAMEIMFHTFLGSQGRIYIPKAVVERFELWVGTQIDVTMLIRDYKKSSFPTSVKNGFMFTVPKRERVFHKLRDREPLKITIIKIEESSK